MPCLVSGRYIGRNGFSEVYLLMCKMYECVHWGVRFRTFTFFG